MSLVATLNGLLGLVAAVCAVLVVGAILFRLAHLLMALLVDMLLLPMLAFASQNDALMLRRGGNNEKKKKSRLQRFARAGLVGAVVQYALSVLLIGVRTAVALLRAVLWVTYAMLPFLMLALLLVLVQERWTEAMLALTDAFNGPIAPILRWVLLAPLTLLDWVGARVLPAWNLAVFTFVQMPMRLLMWLLSSGGAARLFRGLSEAGAVVPALATSGRAFVAANARLDCPLCALNGTYCVAPLVAAQACLDPSVRALDLDPPLALARAAAEDIVGSIGQACGPLDLLLRIALFPVGDPFAWRAVGRVINLALAGVVVAPTATAMRCRMAGGVAVRPAMCTPDWRPVADLAAGACVDVGTALTNWLDNAVGLLSAEVVSSASSPPAAASSSNASAWAAAADALFGGNATALTRLSTTAFALTDGAAVLWVARGGAHWAIATAPAWPIAVDVRFGVARVRLPGAVDGLLACGCADVPAPAGALRGTMVQLQCAVVAATTASGGGGGAAWVLPAEFSLGTEAQLLTCAHTRVVVQSLRWPQLRVGARALNPLLSAPSCIDTAACVAADAAVYVVPVCGAQDGVRALACLPAPSFTRGICYPYCLALRLVGEGLQPLTVRGASEWTDGVVLGSTDCSSTQNPAASAAAAGGAAASVCRVATDVAGAATAVAVGSTSYGTAAGGAGGCGFSIACTSALADRTQHPGYAAPSLYLANGSAAADGGGSYLLQGQQPWALGGGTMLVAAAAAAGGAAVGAAGWTLPSLVGNQANEFTFEVAPNALPGSTDPPPVPALQPPYATRGTVDTPLTAYVDAQIPYNPASLARDALWYATNPSYEPLYAFSEYCWSAGKRVDTQVSILSNYAPPRLQRVLTSPTACYDAAAVGGASGDGVVLCRDDLFTAAVLERTLPPIAAKSAATTALLYQLCASHDAFNLYVEAIEYWDDANMLVAVRRATMADLGELLTTGVVGGRTVYYYAQSADVSQAREGVPWPSASSPSSATAELIATPPVNVPDIGGAIGHSAAALARTLGAVANAVLNPFAVRELLDARVNGTCPDDALGHSALAACGMAVFALDDAFAEVYAANTATWGIVLWLVDAVIFPSANRMPPTDVLGRPLTAAVLRDFLQGTVAVGDATRIVTLFDVAHALSALDVGAVRFLEGEQRRRLLALEEEEAAAAGGGGSKGGSSLLGHVSSGLSKGARAFGALTRLIGSVVSGSLFAGADFSALLSTQSPHTHLVGAVVAAPPVAVAEFTYRAALPLVLDVIASVRAGRPSISTVWRHLATTQDLFDTLVDSRLRQACAGVRLMAGYGTQLGEGLYWNCRASADVAPAMLRLLTTLFADAPLYRCLCVYPAGEDYLTYVNGACPQYIPATRKAYWAVRPSLSMYYMYYNIAPEAR